MLVVLPPNIPPPVVLLFEPNALPVFEPKPEAKDELDRIPRDALVAKALARIVHVSAGGRHSKIKKRGCYLPPEVLLLAPKPKPVDWLLLEPKPPKPPPLPKDMVAVCEASRAR